VAGWYKIGAHDKSGGERVNVQGTRNVLELMRELGIPKGAYTSTCAINSDTHGKLPDENYRFTGKHLSEYDRTKALAHEVAEQFIEEGLPLNIVMPNMVYGPRDTSSVGESFVLFLKGQLPALPSQTAMCWAHVDDVAHGHILAMEAPTIGESYILAGEYCSLADLFKLASQITGKPAPKTVPYQVFKVLSVLVRPFDALLPETYTSEGLRVAAGVTYSGDNTKAKRELGYKPRPLHQGLEETLRQEMARLGM
jgi:nucleoside-diphosphate-sugar epimerase